MSPIRTLIVDDEPLAREGIELRLVGQSDIEVIGSIGRPADAVRAIKRLSPDLLFLDVQMPGMSGFEVLDEAGLDHVPVVVFVTAHDQYALRAFEAHAMDYLLKPVDDDRLADALVRARRHLTALQASDAQQRLRALLDDTRTKTRYPTRLQIKDRGQIIFVDVDDIERVEADGDYVRVHTARKSHLVRQTLGDLERQLDPHRFLRVHRSTIVRLASVVEVRPHLHGEFRLTTRSGARVKVSRSYRGALARALSVKP